MRYMGLDVGDKTIGIAVSDLTRLIAQPIRTLMRVSMGVDIDELVEYAVAENVTKIVVGYPINMNGTKGPRALISEEFKAKLDKKIKYSKRTENTTIEVILWDERLTTVQAERDLIHAEVRRENRKKVIDQLAAVHILQSYLDYERMKTNEPYTRP